MKWKDIEDNFGRRTKEDRRKKSTPEIKTERRNERDRRKNTDRRGKADRRQSEDSNNVQPKSYPKRGPLDRRDPIFDVTEQEN
ncbi:hypothetical protein ACFL6W_09145 [Thermodesulfobacteriota bacterium]